MLCRRAVGHPWLQCAEPWQSFTLRRMRFPLIPSLATACSISALFRPNTASRRRAHGELLVESIPDALERVVGQRAPEAVLAPPDVVDGLRQTVDDCAVHGRRTADTGALEDGHEPAPLGDLEAHVAPDALERRVHVATEGFRGHVRPLLEHDDVEPRLGEYARSRRARRAGTDDHDVRDVRDGRLARHVRTLNQSSGAHRPSPGSRGSRESPRRGSPRRAHSGGVASTGVMPSRDWTSGSPQKPRHATVFKSSGISRTR